MQANHELSRHRAIWRAGLRLAVALVLVLALGIGTAAAYGYLTSADLLIAYSAAPRWGRFQKDIYLLDVQHGTSLNLTRHPANDEFPRWAADGGALFFHSTRLGGEFPTQMNRFRMQPNERGVAHAGREMGAADAPAAATRSFPEIPLRSFEVVERADGVTWLLGARGGDYLLYELHADDPGEPVVRQRWELPMVSASGFPWMAPDGQRFVLTGRQRRGDPTDLYLLEIGSDRVRNITNLPEYNTTNPAWSPDGERLAFVAGRRGEQFIQVLEVPRGNAAATAEAAVLRATGAGLISQLAWSPDGRLIAYGLSSFDGTRLCVVPAAGGESRCFARHIHTFAWRPQGSTR